MSQSHRIVSELQRRDIVSGRFFFLHLWECARSPFRDTLLLHLDNQSGSETGLVATENGDRVDRCRPQMVSRCLFISGPERKRAAVSPRGY